MVSRVVMVKNGYGFIFGSLCNFITKCDKNLLQNVSSVLLKNVTVIIKCVDFMTKSDSHYKIQHLLEKPLVQGGYRTAERCWQ